MWCYVKHLGASSSDGKWLNPPQLFDNTVLRLPLPLRYFVTFSAVLHAEIEVQVESHLLTNSSQNFRLGKIIHYGVP